MGDTPKGHLPLIALDCISLGEMGINPYIIGAHSKCHQQSPSVASGGNQSCLVMLQLPSVISQSVRLASVCMIHGSVGAIIHLPSSVN